MGVNKVIYGATVLVDLTEDSVTPETLVVGSTAHDKSGTQINGENPYKKAETDETVAEQADLLEEIKAILATKMAVAGGGGAPVIEALEVTENGTYTAPEGVNGYSPVVVNVASSGGDTSKEDGLVVRTLTEYHNNRVTSVGNYAFRNCNSLVIVDIPNATSIGEYAFYGCSALTDANFPYVKSVGLEAFNMCGKLTTANFPEVSSIDSYAFKSCWSLITADFPKLTSAGLSAFDGCEALTTVNCPMLNSFNKSYMFRNCKALVVANFPEAIQTGYYGFYGCSSLTTANFPKAIDVGQYSFASCVSLVDVSVPNAVTISSYAFQTCRALTVLDLPLATSVGNFAFYYCTNLVAVILRSSTKVTFGNNRVFESSAIANGTGYIYVPSALLSEYKADSMLSNLVSQIRVLEDYTVDGTVTGALDMNKI